MGKSGETTKTFFETISDTFKVVTDFVKKNWGWFAVGFVALIVAKVAQFAMRLSELYKLWLSVELIKHKNKSPIAVKDTIGTTFLKIAGAIAMIAGAVYLISTIDESRIWSSIGIVAGIAALLIAVNLVSNKLKMDKGAGFGLMGIGAGILLVVMSIKSVMSLLKGLDDPWLLVGAVAGVVIILGILTGMAKKLKGVNFSGDWKTIIAMAASIWIVIQALKPLLKFSWAELGKMAAGLIVIGNVLGGMLKSANKWGSGQSNGLKGLLGAGIAIWLIIRALKPLATMSPKELFKMAASLLVLRYVLKSLIKATSVRKTGGVANLMGFVGIGAAVWIIMDALMPLATMSDSEIGRILVGMLGLRVMLSGLSKILRSTQGTNVLSAVTSLLSMAALAGVMWVFAEALSKIKDIDTEKILSFSGGLSSVLISFGAFTKLAVGSGVAGFIAVIAAVAVIAGLVYWAMNNEHISNFLQSGAEFLGTLVGRFVGAMEAARLKSMADNLSEISTYTYDETGIDNALAIAQKIADFGEALPQKDKFDLLFDRVVGTEMDVLSQEIGHFATAMGTVATEIGKVGFFPLLPLQTRFALMVARQISRFSEGLEDMGVVETALAMFGGSKLSIFSSDMSSFATGFNSFSTEMAEIEYDPLLPDNTGFAIGIAKQIKKFADTLDELSLIDLAAKFFDTSKTKIFSDDMASFAKGFNSFTRDMGKIEYDIFLPAKTWFAVGIAKQIKKFAGTLDELSLIDVAGKIFDVTKTKIFSDDMASFAKGFNSFTRDMGEIEYDFFLPLKTGFAIGIAQQIKNFSDGLDAMGFTELVGGIFGVSELSIFSEGMAAFSGGFNSFTAEMGKIKFSFSLPFKTRMAIAVAGLIRDFGNTIPEVSVWEKLLGWKSKMTSFATDMTDFGDGVASLANSLDGVPSEKAFEESVKAARAAAEEFSGFMDYLAGDDITVEDDGGTWAAGTSKFYSFVNNLGRLGSTISDFGKNTKDVDQNKFGSFITSITELTNTFNTLSQEGFNIETIKGVKDLIVQMGQSIKEIGEAFHKSLAEGITDSDGMMSPIDAAWSIVINAALDGIDAFASDFGTAGKNLVEGFAAGIRNNIDLGINAANKLAKSTLDALKNGLEEKSPSRATMVLGEFFDSGLAYGMKKRIPEVASTAKVVGDTAIETLATALGTHSNSWKTIIMGEGVDGGIVEGVDKGKKSVYDKVYEVGTTAIDTLDEAVTNTTEGLSPVVENFLGLWDRLLGRGGDDKKTTTDSSGGSVSSGSKGGASKSIGPSQTAQHLTYMETVGKGLSQMNQIAALGDKLDDLGKAVLNMKVVMDSGALVGQIGSKVDNYLGTAATLAGRGIR